MRGAGSALFVGILLLIAGVLDIVYGIAAVRDASFYTANGTFVFSSLHTWGWVSIILGVINVQGQIIPVFDIRKRFRLPERELRLSNQLIIAAASKRTVGIIVDTVTGVIEQAPDRTFAAEQIFPGLGYVAGVAKLV